MCTLSQPKGLFGALRRENKSNNQISPLHSPCSFTLIRYPEPHRVERRQRGPKISGGLTSLHPFSTFNFRLLFDPFVRPTLNSQYSPFTQHHDLSLFLSPCDFKPNLSFAMIEPTFARFTAKPAPIHQLSIAALFVNLSPQEQLYAHHMSR